jgi:2-oxoglutarate dehydrogenase complex dehydrogenase (E1) component-like enzyme
MTVRGRSTPHARVERYHADGVPSTNIQVVHADQPPAQMVPRIASADVAQPYRKPLVIVHAVETSAAQAKEATSSDIDELVNGSFKTVIPENNEADASIDGGESEARGLSAPARCITTWSMRAANVKSADDVAILRLEQLYPFPHKAFGAELKKYPNATDIVWCQDEPQNQGPGSSCSTRCTRTCSTVRSWVTPAAQPRPRRPWVMRTCTRTSRRPSSRPPSASSRASSSPNKRFGVVSPHALAGRGWGCRRATPFDTSR